MKRVIFFLTLMLLVASPALCGDFYHDQNDNFSTNTQNGHVLHKTGQSAVDPQTGKTYNDVGTGYIDAETGQFNPKTNPGAHNNHNHGSHNDQKKMFDSSFGNDDEKW